MEGRCRDLHSHRGGEGRGRGAPAPRPPPLVLLGQRSKNCSTRDVEPSSFGCKSPAVFAGLGIEVNLWPL